jgi:hypothetical protein
MTSFNSRLTILTFITFQIFATGAAALPTVIDAGQFTDRHRPTLPNPVIPAGDQLLIYAEIQTTDSPGCPTIAVSAKQGDTTVILERRTELPNEYLGFIDFNPNVTGAWEIVLTDSTGTGPSAFTNALAEPEFLPYVESITTQGSPLGALVEWTLPDLTDFDVESVHVRIVQDTPRSTVFATLLPSSATSFEPPPALLQYGVEYAYGIGLIDEEGFYFENRSVAQSQPFRFVLPGDFNADGIVDAADYVVWRKDFSGDPAKFNQWRANFGISLGPGSGSVSPSAEPLPVVPEPYTLITLLIGFSVMQCRLRRVST